MNGDLAGGVELAEGVAAAFQPLREAADAVADASDPLARVEARESLERLVRLIERLPDRDQELIALKYGAELDHRAIGRQLGLSETHVGSLAHRIVTKLRSAIESEGSVTHG